MVHLLQVNIGLIDANPSSVSGVIQIMTELQKHVPRINGNLRVVPTHGDALSVERMVDSQRAKVGELTDEQKLLGLLPIPQEFHHRGLMLQVHNFLVNNFCKYILCQIYVYTMHVHAFSMKELEQ